MSSLVGRKCRASEALVVGLYELDGTDVSATKEGLSLHDGTVAYRVGETVVPDLYNDDILVRRPNGPALLINAEGEISFRDAEGCAFIGDFMDLDDWGVVPA